MTQQAAYPAPVPSHLVEAYRSIVTPHISDNLERLPGSVGLAPLNKAKLVGTAVTVHTRHGDNLMIHQALDNARPGDVIVVDGGGDVSQALVGEIMMRKAIKRGIVGFVIFGAVRDVAAFRASDFPCYTLGVTHKGPYKNGPGNINVPVVIGGMVVNPGDLIVGDEDGLIAISPELAISLLPAIRTVEEKEAAIMAEIEASSDGARSLKQVY
ncbi:RraA family protein [Ensifer sp. ENS05]|uniref:RraA family protein n=1 Tax=Ensifer sp. ENS05 TaxID=2769277 RepID=UPI00178559A8|nr:RraA family protein [Ensifer sp. ENS05]MBD9596397.1 RraA family protein [Ensifer sp. ENS05]